MDMEAEHKRFQSWIKSLGLMSMRKEGADEYISSNRQLDWTVWQAAIASRAPAAGQEGGCEMIAYVLIVLSAVGGGNTGHSYAISMQKFSDAKACQFASLQVRKMAQPYGIDAVCVPEASK